MLDEYRELRRVLNEVEDNGTVILSPIHAICLLMLTDCRKSETVMLQWDDIGLVYLGTSHSTRKDRLTLCPITLRVEAVISFISRTKNAWVITGKNPSDC